MPKLNLGWFLPAMLLAVLFASPMFAGAYAMDGTELAVWMAIPFAGILLSIAIFPLVAPHFWHHHFGKISAVWAVLGVLVLFLGPEAAYPGGAFKGVIYEVLHIILLDYVPFIILLLGLFTIAGGIRVKGRLRGSPMLNTILLAIGTILASWMGTTGAAMLLIRPILKANAWRKKKVHIVVFFIFLVCNIGGSLTPLGDPPLFLGFLRGVDFFWTVKLLPGMVICSVILLAVFYVFDMLMLKREEHQTPPAEDGEEEEAFGMEGGINFLLLGGLIAVILVSSTLAKGPDGAFFDKEAAAKYDHQLEAAVAMTNGLQEAAKVFDAGNGDVAKAIAGYQAAKKNEKAAFHHAEDAHADSQPNSTDDHGDHAEEVHGINISVEQAEERGAKDWAGGIDKRIAQLNNLDSLNAEQKTALQKLMVLDFQLASIQTNSVRYHQGHDSAKGIHLPLGLTMPFSNLLRDGVILLLAIISWFITSRESRKKNGFTWFPIVEVAKLFAGIFICIIPALKILQAGVNGELASVVGMVTAPDGGAKDAYYFWLTGSLSSFLDNAPTYLVFFNTAGGDASTLMGGVSTLLAISMGAVFMGANTYIGNAPNFMVKAIAEENDIAMPSFFGYMVWSIIFLIPLFVIITFLMPMITDMVS